MPKDDAIVDHQSSPAYPVVLWVDDDPESFSFIVRRVTNMAEVIRFTETQDLNNRSVWRYLERQARPILVCVSMQRSPTQEDFRLFLDNVKCAGVISDLEIGGNSVAGMVVLSVAASSRFTPQIIVNSAHIDSAIAEVAKALGVNQFFLKRRDETERLLETVLRLLGLEHTYEASRQLIDLTDELERLRRENSKLRTEKTKLKNQIKNLVKSPSRNAPVPKKEAVSKDLVKLRGNLSDLESQIQLVLAHHHDLTSTSSLTVQSLDHLMSEPRLLPPVVSDEIERARVSAKHCDVLVSSLATLTTKETNRQKFSPASVGRAVNEAVQIIQRKVPETVGLRVRIPDRLPLCNLPEHLLVRCILNLLLNSLEALPDGGTIEISAKVLGRKTKHVQLQIDDNGKGVKKLELVKVFESNFSTKGKANGLGLFIVKKTLTDFGGAAFLKSERGRGTQVTLKLPAA